MKGSQNQLLVRLCASSELAQAGYSMLSDRDPMLFIQPASMELKESLSAITERRPHLLVVDMSGSAAKAIALIEGIHFAQPALPIIALNGPEDTQLTENALRAGARGYGTRKTSMDEMIKAIHSVATGGLYIEASLAQRIALQKLMGKSQRLKVLSDREYSVFCLLAEGRSLNEISDQLEIKYKTVANYHSKIKEKLAVNSKAELKEIAVSSGVTLG